MSLNFSTATEIRSWGADAKSSLNAVKSNQTKGKNQLTSIFQEMAKKAGITEAKSDINEDKINIIIDLLLNSTLSQTDIALTVDINPFTVGEINRGKNSWCPKDLEYPLRKPVQKNTYQNIIGLNEVREICYKLCFTDIKLEDIGKEYNVAKNTIGDISRGISWKEITHQFKCPIRKNKLENQKVYNSIYGIV